MEGIEKGIFRLSKELIDRQSDDGSWRFCFEAGTMTDSYMLLLMKVCKMDDSRLRNKLVERILMRQNAEGFWKLYEDEADGNVSATIECVLALLYSEAKQISDPEIKKAYAFLRHRGGDQKASLLTKILLTLLGHRSWSEMTSFPIELLLLPLSKRANLFQFVGYARVHLVPILITAQQKFQIKLPNHKKIDTWFQPLKSKTAMNSFHFDIPALQFSPKKSLRRRALQAGVQFMLDRMESDHTLYSYMTSTFFMIFAFLSLHDSQYTPTIHQAYQGLQSFYCPLSSTGHLQETTSTVWDTSLILHALQIAGMPAQHATVQKGLRYLVAKQHKHRGDWALKNPDTPPGGWGFSNINTINPDNDDTAACLRALAPTVFLQGSYQKVWERGIIWLLSMQNQDGGWSAFEKDTDPFFLKWIPNPTLRNVLADPSTPDLTGRVLEFLGSTTDCHPHDTQIQNACQWLLAHQQKDGSWFGRWGICFIYGTWAALTGLHAVHIRTSHPQIKKALKWLLSIQNEDGGWGESCASDHAYSYIPLHKSNLVQTAWALDALVTYHRKPIPEIRKGIRCLLQLLQQNNIDPYPTGAGFAGQFYIHYHSYRYIWPLITLTRIRNQYRKFNI